MRRRVHNLTLGAPRTAGRDGRIRGEESAESVGSGTAAADGVEKGSSRLGVKVLGELGRKRPSGRARQGCWKVRGM